MRLCANTSKTVVRSLGIIFSILLLGVFAAPATAQSVTQGYDETGVLGEIDESGNPGGGNLGGGDDAPRGEVGEDDSSTTPRESGAAVPSQTASGELPFTGLESGLILMIGMALLGTGVVLRRTQRDT